MIPPLEILLAEACPWATEQQAKILQDGIALSDTQLGDATKIGILRPKKVRLLRVPQIPSPTTPALVLAMKALNSDPNSVRGRTFWYGIYIRAMPGLTDQLSSMNLFTLCSMRDSAASRDFLDHIYPSVSILQVIHMGL
jgi:hypothetical protein